MSYYIDTHCHLDLFKDIKRVSHDEDALPIKTITVTNSPSFFAPNEKLFAKAKNIRVGLGMHPELSQRFQAETSMFNELISQTKYIGEIGLDGSKDFKNSFQIQKKVLESILISVKREENKLLTVHSRNASSETVEMLDKYLSRTNCKVILHWYTGNKFDLLNAVKLGFFFSINHQMVVSKKGRELIECIPTANLLTETDAPFTFEPKIKNRVKSLDKAIEGISAIKGIGSDEVKNLIYTNFSCLLKSLA